MSKHEYIEKLKNQLAEWEQDMERLETKMDQVQGIRKSSTKPCLI